MQAIKLMFSGPRGDKPGKMHVVRPGFNRAVCGARLTPAWSDAAGFSDNRCSRCERKAPDAYPKD